jgi:hypothetical protein
MAVPASVTIAVPTATLALSPTTPGATLTPVPPIGQRTKTSGCLVAGALPDGACTPGAIIASATTGQICTSGYAKSVRNVSTAEKNTVYTEYGITSHRAGEYEVDHLISLELGGSNDIANLWPEPADPRPGFHEKDRVENELHARLCAGTITLADAQRQIAVNWLDLWNRGVAGAVDAAGDSSLDVEAPATVTISATSTPAPVATRTAPPNSTNSPAPAPAGVTFLSVVGGRPGQTASVSVQTTPGASCAITYVTPHGTVSVAQGLVTKTADTSGHASWTWLIGARTEPGTGTVTVACGGVSTSAGIAIG